MEQLQLFEMTETDKINQKIHECIKSTDNLRKGVFSRHDVLFKMYNEMKTELEQIRHEISDIKQKIDMFCEVNYIPQEAFHNCKLINFPLKRSL